jgi:Spy/CpxP family protein refolding chaperone
MSNSRTDVPDNRGILAKMMASHAVQRARRTDLRPPQDRAMEALKEAIDSKRGEVQRMVVTGQLNTDAYRDAKAQLARWHEAWSSNR